jgi:hypothetical protein
MFREYEDAVCSSGMERLETMYMGASFELLFLW